MLIQPLGTNISEIFTEVHWNFSFQNIHLKMSSINWWRRSFYLGLNVLTNPCVANHVCLLPVAYTLLRMHSEGPSIFGQNTSRKQCNNVSISCCTCPFHYKKSTTTTKIYIYCTSHYIIRSAVGHDIVFNIWKWSIYRLTKIRRYHIRSHGYKN